MNICEVCINFLTFIQIYIYMDIEFRIIIDNLKPFAYRNCVHECIVIKGGGASAYSGTRDASSQSWRVRMQVFLPPCLGIICSNVYFGVLAYYQKALLTIIIIIWNSNRKMSDFTEYVGMLKFRIIVIMENANCFKVYSLVIRILGFYLSGVYIFFHASLNWIHIIKNVTFSYNLITILN